MISFILELLLKTEYIAPADTLAELFMKVLLYIERRLAPSINIPAPFLALFDMKVEFETFNSPYI